MPIDYYDILQLQPSASLAEIKSAYRKLAHLYHPDKNHGDSVAKAHFELIKEAYEVLSHPVKKEKYLQERWHSKAHAIPFQHKPTTAHDILITVLNTGNKVMQMDQYRMNKEGLKNEINNLLSDENIKILYEFNELNMNDAIVKELLQMINILPTADELTLLKRLRCIDNTYTATIKEREELLNGNLFWETWKPAFILLMVILICILIWGTSLT